MPKLVFKLCVSRIILKSFEVKKTKRQKTCSFSFLRSYQKQPVHRHITRNIVAIYLSRPRYSWSSTAPLVTSRERESLHAPNTFSTWYSDKPMMTDGPEFFSLARNANHFVIARWQKWPVNIASSHKKCGKNIEIFQCCQSGMNFSKENNFARKPCKMVAICFPCHVFGT